MCDQPPTGICDPQPKIMPRYDNCEDQEASDGDICQGYQSKIKCENGGNNSCAINQSHLLICIDKASGGAIISSWSSTFPQKIIKQTVYDNANQPNDKFFIYINDGDPIVLPTIYFNNQYRCSNNFLDSENDAPNILKNPVVIEIINRSKSQDYTFGVFYSVHKNCDKKCKAVRDGNTMFVAKCSSACKTFKLLY